MGTTRTDEEHTERNTAVDQVRTSLLAALGAGNLAGQAVADAVTKARTRLSESSETARRTVEELPTELESLRGRLDPAELRRLVDDYSDSALRLYHRLAETGEQTWDRLSEQPQVRRSREQVGEALHAAQERTTDARVQLDELVSLITRRAREAEHDTTSSARPGTPGRAEKPGPAFDRAAESTPTSGTGTSGATSGSGTPRPATGGTTESTGRTGTGPTGTGSTSTGPTSTGPTSTGPTGTHATGAGGTGSADTGSTDGTPTNGTPTDEATTDEFTKGGQAGKAARGGTGARRTQSRRSPNGSRGDE